VICERRLRSLPGQRVGLSFGGGGTAQEYCRYGHCVAEQSDGIMRDNLIASCSDAGIYLNKSARTTLRSNTILDTVGIDARYPETAASLSGNLVDGVIRARDGAISHDSEDMSGSLIGAFVGFHPGRRWFTDVGTLDLRWRGDPPRDASANWGGIDLCGVRREGSQVVGAFDSFARCLGASN
jgi:parallel beta-helix repeat protein